MRHHSFLCSHRRAPAGLASLVLLCICPAVALCRPIVYITSPSDQAVVSGETWINVAFRSDSRRPIVRLELQLDGKDLQSYVVPSPLLEGQKSFPVDMSGLQPGTHRLSVRALDSVGEAGATEITINAQPRGPGVAEYDRIPPVISIYYPAQGATVSGRVTIRAEATDNAGVRNVIFFVDGKLHTIRMNAPPFHAEWDTTGYPDGPHVLEARAKDTTDNEGVSAPVTVIVQNNAPEPPAPPTTAPPGGRTPTPAGWGPVRTPIPPTGPWVIGPSEAIPGPGPGGSSVIAVPGPTSPGPTGRPAIGERPAIVSVPPRLVYPQPEVAIAPGTSIVALGDSGLASPPSLSPEAAVPTGERPKAAVPGTDLSVPEVGGPELAIPEATPLTLAPVAPGELDDTAVRPALDVPTGGAVAKPNIETLAVPELATPEFVPRAPEALGGSLQGSDSRPELEIPSGGAVAKPAVEVIPEPKTPALSPSEPEPTEESTETAPASAEPAPGASSAVTPETTSPAPEADVREASGETPPTPGAGAEAVTPAPITPPPSETTAPEPEPGSTEPPKPQPEVRSAPPPPLSALETAAVGAPPAASSDEGPSAGLIAPTLELYHEDAVPVLPEASIKPAPRKPRPSGAAASIRTQRLVVTPPIIVEPAVEKPAEKAPETTPVESSTPKQTPVEPAAAEKPADEPVEKPPAEVAEPEESPAEPTVVEKPAEKPVEKAAPKPAESPTAPALPPTGEKPAEKPVEIVAPEPPAPTEQPAEAPVVVEKPVEKPVESPAATPSKPSTPEPRKSRTGLRRMSPTEVVDDTPSPAAITPAPRVARDQLAAKTHRLTVADAAGLPGAEVIFGGRVLPEGAAPELRDGVLVVSLKHIFEAANGALYWFPEQRTARAITADADLTVQIGSSRVALNGKSREMATPATTREGRVLIPLSLVAEALGLNFEFDPAARRVIVTQ